jgi:hypothetical protein
MFYLGFPTFDSISRGAPSASGGRGGRSRRAGGTAPARPAAIAIRSRRHTHGPHSVPPAPAGEDDRVAWAAQLVLVPPSTRRIAGGTHLGRTARPRALHQRRLGRAVASRGRHGACRPAAIAMRRRQCDEHPKKMTAAQPANPPSDGPSEVAIN